MSSLQVLLHQGELEYIVKTIEKSKKTPFVFGCLFGLWRNSLKQPVVQFVTGPGKEFEDSTSMQNLFDSNHVETCAHIIKKEHRLLHLGFWFCGSEEHQAEAKRAVFAGHGLKYSLLMFINVAKNENQEKILSGEFHVRAGGCKEETSELFKEDVLPGQSSFRLYEPLTRSFLDDIVSPTSASRIDEDILALIDTLPSRVQVEEAVTNEAQWYSTEKGMQRLQRLAQYFSQTGIQVGMSRDANTHNFQFDLEGGHCVDFPANFPARLPILRNADGRYFPLPLPTGKCDDVCRYVVEAVAGHLHSPQPPRNSGRRGQRGGQKQL